MRPRLVLLARADGTLIFADDFEAIAGHETAEWLARELVGHVSQDAPCRLEIDTDGGPRLALALRLPECVLDGFVACLMDPPGVRGGPLGDAEATALLCGAMTRATLRCKARECESLARTKQLIAGQDALAPLDSRNLAEAIQEHEACLHERELAEGELKAGGMLAINSFSIRPGKGSSGWTARGRWCLSTLPSKE